ncbi:MAG: methionine ABC transporter ATP-binding protein [Halobacteriovoraceae bacterium]|nr:methionine ABC transporter ATP-binding protein [Halobacteriovoraceae bacterium]|tara:strand:+ start:802 stop:1494 length:693 start_codon:yes stop_codon:yes gene_type:complete
MESQSSLEFKKLKFSYKSPSIDKKPILEIDTFQVMKGEKVFLYGPSGCGKSTLLNLVAGVLKPTEGSIRVLGHDFDLLSSSKKDQIRGEKIGYIFQSFNLIPYLSVKENILLPLWMNKKKDTSSDNLDGILKSLNIEELQDSEVVNLSIGQQQRVAAARALVGEPQLVIADEPTSSLDKKNTLEFMELLLKKWEEKRFTLLFVSHDETLADFFEKKVSLEELNVRSGKEQ